MKTKNTRPNDEAQIQQVITDWTSAQCAKDVDRLMFHYATDVVVFGVNPPFHTTGVAAWRRVWEAALSHFPASFGVEMRDFRIAVSGDLALAHWQFRYTGMGAEHSATQTWMRTTVGYKRCKDRWRIVHEHYSVPFVPNA